MTTSSWLVSSTSIHTIWEPKKKLNRAYRAKMNRRSLISIVKLIQLLGKTHQWEISTIDMAIATKTSTATFQRYLAGKSRIPYRIVDQVRKAFAELFEIERRESEKKAIKNTIVWIRNLGLAAGLDITLNAIASKMNITKTELLSYIQSTATIPVNFSYNLKSAYAQLFAQATSLRVIEDFQTILNNSAY